MTQELYESGPVRFDGDTRDDGDDARYALHAVEEAMESRAAAEGLAGAEKAERTATAIMCAALAAAVQDPLDARRLIRRSDEQVEVLGRLNAKIDKIAEATDALTMAINRLSAKLEDR